ncbi:MAG: hypothetical protein AAFO85_17870, partial [Cyanobacteria bacterium J06598_4]
EYDRTELDGALMAPMHNMGDIEYLGVRWKSSNVCSRDVLTDRGLDHQIQAKQPTNLSYLVF